MRLCTLGDLLLDVVVRTSGSSGPEAEGSAETRVGAGGQAANVAAWAASLGAEARFVGKRGTDAAAELAAREVSSRGVELFGPVEEGRNGVVVSLVTADGSRTMLTDRGVAPFLRAEELDVRWFAGCEWLHLSGYSLLRRPIEEAAAKAAGAIQAQGGRISIDLASAVGNRRVRAEQLLKRLELLVPDLVFANEGELDAIGGAVPGASCSSAAPTGSRWTARITRRWTAEVVDTTGAGDALAAGFLVGGPELAAQAASRCVVPAGSDAVIEVAPEVREALRRRAPVVALETTLVAHGFPAGEGVAVGLESAQRVRDAGAVPATVGVLDGALRVGLSDAELERFTADARKVGPRDLAAAVVQGAVGATTVGGTLAACRAVGIGFMGDGRHRRRAPRRPDRRLRRPARARADRGARRLAPGSSRSWTCRRRWSCWRRSACRCSASGPTSCRSSTPRAAGRPSPARVESAEEAAAVARTHWQLKRRSGLLLAQPPPTSLDDVEPLIEQALAAAEEQGVAGPGRDTVRPRLPPRAKRRRSSQRC